MIVCAFVCTWGVFLCSWNLGYTSQKMGVEYKLTRFDRDTRFRLCE